jgi:hypothetical protein
VRQVAIVTIVRAASFFSARPVPKIVQMVITNKPQHRVANPVTRAVCGAIQRQLLARHAKMDCSCKLAPVFQDQSVLQELILTPQLEIAQ